MATYKCQVCKEKWEFIAEDFEYNKKLYPNICVFCESPILWTIKELIENKNLPLLVKVIKSRILVKIEKLFK